MPHTTLVDVLLAVSDHDYEFLERLRRLAATESASALVLDRLREQVRLHLAVGYVRWDGVTAFVGGLDRILGEISAVGTRAPRVALDAALEFLEALPAVFDVVQGEDQLGDFADELATVIFSLAARSDVPLEEPATRVLAAIATDAHGHYARLGEAIVRAWDGSPNATLAAIAERHAAEARVHDVELRDLAATLSRGRRP